MTLQFTEHLPRLEWRCAPFTIRREGGALVLRQDLPVMASQRVVATFNASVKGFAAAIEFASGVAK